MKDTAASEIVSNFKRDVIKLANHYLDQNEIFAQQELDHVSNSQYENGSICQQRG